MTEKYSRVSPFKVYISFKKYLDVLEHIRYNDRLEYRAQYAESLIEKTKNFKEFREGFQDETLLEKACRFNKTFISRYISYGAYT